MEAYALMVQLNCVPGGALYTSDLVTEAVLNANKYEV